MKICPECGEQMIHQSGCAYCPSCGYSVCLCNECTSQDDDKKIYERELTVREVLQA